MLQYCPVPRRHPESALRSSQEAHWSIVRRSRIAISVSYTSQYFELGCCAFESHWSAADPHDEGNPPSHWLFVAAWAVAEGAEKTAVDALFITSVDRYCGSLRGPVQRMAQDTETSVLEMQLEIADE